MSKDGLAWRLVTVTPEAAEWPSVIFAVARARDGRFFYVFRQDVIWD